MFLKMSTPSMLPIHSVDFFFIVELNINILKPPSSYSICCILPVISLKWKKNDVTWDSLSIKTAATITQCVRCVLNVRCCRRFFFLSVYCYIFRVTHCMLLIWLQWCDRIIRELWWFTVAHTHSTIRQFYAHNKMPLAAGPVFYFHCFCLVLIFHIDMNRIFILASNYVLDRKRVMERRSNGQPEWLRARKNFKFGDYMELLGQTWAFRVNFFLSSLYASLIVWRFH